MFVRPTVRLVFRRRNMCMLSKFVSAKPQVLLKLLFHNQHIMSGHDRPAREIPWGGGGGWIRPWSWQDVKKQNLTKENLHLNTPPPPPHTHTHTHFHHETWSFLGPSPRSFFGIILSKQKPHVNVGNSQNQTSCILQLQLSRLFPLCSILF